MLSRTRVFLSLPSSLVNSSLKPVKSALNNESKPLKSPTLRVMYLHVKILKIQINLV